MGEIEKLLPLPQAEPVGLADSTNIPSGNCIGKFKGAWDRLKQSSPDSVFPALEMLWCGPRALQRPVGMMPPMPLGG